MTDEATPRDGADAGSAADALEEVARRSGLGGDTDGGAPPRSTARLGELAAELERQLQSDRRADVPDEPILRSGGTLGRWMKRTMYDTLRPITRRYDRICASLATLSTSTAERLEALEAEVARLRRRVEDAEGGPSDRSSSGDDSPGA